MADRTLPLLPIAEEPSGKTQDRKPDCWNEDGIEFEEDFDECMLEETNFGEGPPSEDELQALKFFPLAHRHRFQEVQTK